MLTDSDLRLSDLQLLCQWLTQQGTQELVRHLKDQVEGLQDKIINHVPQTRSEEILREQSIGEVRGYRALLTLFESYQPRLEELTRREEDQNGNEQSDREQPDELGGLGE